MTLRIAYNLFTQSPGGELEDFRRWAGMIRPGTRDSHYRMNGAGEMLTYSAADFEDFLEARPDLPPALEKDLPAVVRLLAERRRPFRLHATYDQSIGRFLDIFEAVNRDVPFDGLHWFFDHAETVTDRNLERIKALGGGVAIQHRMAYQGEYFVDRYGAEAAERTPPIARMLAMGLPVAAGTDATRVASYNPWVCLHWLVTGRTVGGLSLYPEANRLDRERALRLWNRAAGWFANEEGARGTLKAGELADLAVLTEDYFAVPEGRIPGIESVLTLLGGKVVHAAGPYGGHAPPPLPIRPDWSPVGIYGGYHRAAAAKAEGGASLRRAASRHQFGCQGGSWGDACGCWAF